MASPTASSLGLQRLAYQLHQLSEVTEAITWRLLELEERLGAQEHQLGKLEEETDSVESGSGAAMAAVASRLEDTDQRQARIEMMLRGDGLSEMGFQRHLRPVPPHAIQQELIDRSEDAPCSDHGVDPSASSPDTVTFQEEGDQQFIDQLSA